MKLCAAWLLYWGRKFGMQKYEVLHTRLGEMLEMIDCHAIANGAAPQKRKLTYDEAIQMR